ncbi:hypothetical protein KI387_009359, partial [Taxus chinensis]
VTLLVEDPLSPTSTTPLTNILDMAIQHDNSNTNDFDDYNDEVDTVELIDDKLGNLNFTPIDVDDSYFNDNFIVDGI